MIKAVATILASALFFVLADEYLYYGQHTQMVAAMMRIIAHSFGA
jgi:hypothetical protein